MLEVYDPSYITEDSEMCNTKDIATLLINGEIINYVYEPVIYWFLIFLVFLLGVRDSSDMLALMYAGEMCYWYYDLSNQSPPLNIFPARQMAVHFLQKYVKLSKEPCFGQSWSCDRAISLLNLLISSSQWLVFVVCILSIRKTLYTSRWNEC